MYIAAITQDLHLAKSCKLDKDNKFVIRTDATDLAYLVSVKDCILIRSNYRNPLTAVFKRSPDRKNKALSRSIELDDLPQRFTGDAALALIEQCSRWRGEDKKPRQMHPNSLANLRPLSKGCKALPRYYRAPVELAERACQLRTMGHSLKAIGDTLDLSDKQVKYLLEGSLTSAKNKRVCADVAPASESPPNLVSLVYSATN